MPKRERFFRFASTAFAGLCAAALTYVLALNLTVAQEGALWLKLSAVTVVTAALVLTVWGAASRISVRAAAAALFCCAFAAKLAAALAVDARPISDFEMMLNASRMLTEGDLSFNQFTYFRRWAYQTGFVAYQAALLRVFGDGRLPLYVFNSLFMAGTNTLLYGIAYRLTGSKHAAFAAGCLYLTYPAPYMLASVLTNQHIAAFFIYLGLFLLTGEKRRYAAAGVCLAAGNIMRPIGIVALLAGLCYIALKERRFSLWGMTAFAGSYLAVCAVAGWLVIATGLNPNGLKNTFPLWKFAVGLNVDTNGTYDPALAVEVSGLDERSRDELIRARIESYFNKPSADWLRFADRKNRYMWAAYEDTLWSWPGESSSRLASLQRLEKCFFIAAYALASFGMVYSLFSRRVSPAFVLICITFLLYFSVHLLIEVRPRYRYFAMPSVFVLASVSLDVVYCFWRDAVYGVFKRYRDSAGSFNAGNPGAGPRLRYRRELSGDIRPVQSQGRSGADEGKER